ncbi:PTS N-acetylglucosamine transporter subunit IIABC [Periweissella cryptocerci]|uniref:PTS N-acetylglucosamine transporter subunit IIABC n=1 Tax=Periweissella cryptocerci TaxID=2506420 RepID=A0A4P6YTI8_9LACO|nr:N-acetylglucosamine-specific PTS transporter subunit IIBC [Periweissella cryptocerci]QBO36068.1 PTS N-acetylglucosamine transporter subunit IIABC [Periweissella cryptocerci]
MKDYFQRMGRSLMLPVAVLPAASILVGIGNWLVTFHVGFIAQFMIAGGLAILNALPYLFAIGLALGMAKSKDGAAALAGFVAYIVPLNVLSPANMALLSGIKVDKVNPAFTAISGNVLIGIIAGLVAAAMFNRFSEVKLPQAISFFSGKRLVPIMSAIVMLVVSLALMIVWPPIYDALVAFGKMVVGMGPIGAGLYGFFNRLLIPTGLHHALNSVFWFNVANINDIQNFLTGHGVLGITGRYQAGFFPVMMFGLPAGAFAIYRQARPAQKKRVGSLMLAAAFASFFTGVTEPLEFSFMFVAWPLFVLHAVLTGLSMFIAAFFHWTNGFAFSAGLVDFAVDYHLKMAHQPYMLLVLGVFMAFLYYVTFTFAIKKFNLMTPGRDPKEDNVTDDDDDANGAVTDATGVVEDHYLRTARKIWAVLGSGNLELPKERLTYLYNCTTRLRYKLVDTSVVDIDALKHIKGVAGVNVLDEHQIHIVIGPDVQFVADNIEKIYNGQISPELASAVTADEDNEVIPGLQAMEEDYFAVAEGQLMNITEVDDDVFSAEMLGKGYAVEPTNGKIVSPVAGEVTMVFPTKHAMGIKTANGTDVLLHMGINTVELEGKPFDVTVEAGQQVKAGDVVANADLDAIKAAGKQTVMMVIFTNLDDSAKVDIDASRAVEAGEYVARIERD